MAMSSDLKKSRNLAKFRFDTQCNKVDVKTFCHLTNYMYFKVKRHFCTIFYSTVGEFFPSSSPFAYLALFCGVHRVQNCRYIQFVFTRKVCRFLHVFVILPNLNPNKLIQGQEQMFKAYVRVPMTFIFTTDMSTLFWTLKKLYCGKKRNRFEIVTILK